MANEASADARDLLKRAIALHRDGDLTHSERLYLQVLEAEPEQTDALQLLGVIAAQMGNTTLAIERVNRSIALNPDQPGALNNLGNMLVEEQRYEEAIECYERAIHFDPTNAQAYFHRGHVFLSVGRHLDAVSSYTRSTDLEPDNATHWSALGNALEMVGRLADAANAFQKSIALDAGYLSPKSGLGKVLRRLGRLDEASEVYRRWLEIEPNNPIAKHYALVCGSPDGVPQRASEDYVKKTFDNFAEDFDRLLSDLNYQVPELLGEMARRVVPAKDDGQLDVVDLGCGTGLCGEHLRDLAKHLVGVDLSAGMLAQARQRMQYDELIECELTQHLRACSDDYDLIVSADTLIYIGDLQETFVAASSALRAGAALIFSVEKWESRTSDHTTGESSRQAGYRLGVSGRYSHSESSIREWLAEAGFEVKEFVEANVRKEGDSEVTGFLVAAIRIAAEEPCH